MPDTNANTIARDPDVTVHNHGSIWQFDLHSDSARDWVSDNVSEIPSYMRTPDGFMAEHRYADMIALGMINDGLFVEPA